MFADTGGVPSAIQWIVNEIVAPDGPCLIPVRTRPVQTVVASGGAVPPTVISS